MALISKGLWNMHWSRSLSKIILNRGFDTKYTMLKVPFPVTCPSSSLPPSASKIGISPRHSHRVEKGLTANKAVRMRMEANMPNAVVVRLDSLGNTNRGY